MVKRVGHLMERIASRDNLFEAFLRAARGKQTKKEVTVFRNKLDENISVLQHQLLDGTFRFGNYHFFVIHDPKRREICAASFQERVVFHAMMRICHPVFDQYQVYDSYASRLGKGTYKALERTQQFARRYAWFVKLDMKKYFDSIDHGILMRQLCRLFKDPLLLTYFQQLVRGYQAESGKGLPIGNLTSQYFANHYLAEADHFVKEVQGVPAMVRYMDDVLLFSNNKDRLIEWTNRYQCFVNEELRLATHGPVMNRTPFGIPFLGYVVYDRGMRLNRRSKQRFEKKMRDLSASVNLGLMEEKEYAMRTKCLMAFVQKAETNGFLCSMATKKGVYPQGL